MQRTLPPLLAALLGCASVSSTDHAPRADAISSCWTRFGGGVLEQTTAALALRECAQECEDAAATEGTAAGETEAPPACERECEEPSEAEEIEIASAAWLQTSPECHEHAQVLARRTRKERQQTELASRQQDWSDAPPISEYEREIWELDRKFKAEEIALKNESTAGEIEIRERMGKKSIVLHSLVAPVIREQDFALVYTVELLMVLSDTGAEVGISPKYRHEREWSWLKCHDAGLWKNEPWTSAPDVKGSDGHWVHVESVHDGDVADDRLNEWVMFNLSLETLRELATAEHSGGQVCNDKFELSVDQKATILSFINYTIPDNGAQAN